MSTVAAAAPLECPPPLPTSAPLKHAGPTYIPPAHLPTVPTSAYTRAPHGPLPQCAPMCATPPPTGCPTRRASRMPQDRPRAPPMPAPVPGPTSSPAPPPHVAPLAPPSPPPSRPEPQPAVRSTNPPQTARLVRPITHLVALSRSRTHGLLATGHHHVVRRNKRAHSAYASPETTARCATRRCVPRALTGQGGCFYCSPFGLEAHPTPPARPLLGRLAGRWPGNGRAGRAAPAAGILRAARRAGGAAPAGGCGSGSPLTHLGARGLVELGGGASGARQGHGAGHDER